MKVRLIRVLQRNWSRIVRHRLFPPPCARAECARHAGSRIWRTLPPIRFRNRCFCSPLCVEQELRRIFAHELTERPADFRHRIPLGLLLLSRGYVSEHQLRAALEAQQAAGKGKIGEWVQMLHYATERQVLAALSVQWACPLLVLQDQPDPGCASSIPLPLLRSLQWMPVRSAISGSLLYIAVSQRVDYAALGAIEQMLECRTIPGLISDHEMQKMQERLPQAGPFNLHVFDRTSGGTEMARITASYVATLGADEIRLACCAGYEWVRLRVAGRATDLLFSLSKPVAGHAADGSDWDQILHQAS